MTGNQPRVIGVDGRALQGRRTGVGRYVAELCECLDRLMPTTSFIIYSNVPVDPPRVSSRWKVRVDGFFLSKRLKAIVWLKWRCGAMARRDGVEVFWGTSALLPNLPKRVRTVITVHDLNFLLVPHAMVNTHRLAHQLFFRRDLLRADHVTTNSRGTADRLLRAFGRDADAVVLAAVSEGFRPVAPEPCRDTLLRLGVSSPYLLAVATWEPRKNLGLLIRAFLSLKERGKLPGCKLVLVGGKGWKDENLRALLTGGREADLMPLGYVEDADLPALYTASEAFVFPSIYEGFGMPALEARACGTRVVCSDLPEIREAAGPGAIYVQPTLEGIEAGIEAALANPKPGVRPEGLPAWEEGAAKLRDLMLGADRA